MPEFSVNLRQNGSKGQHSDLSYWSSSGALHPRPPSQTSLRGWAEDVFPVGQGRYTLAALWFAGERLLLSGFEGISGMKGPRKASLEEGKGDEGLNVSPAWKRAVT